MCGLDDGPARAVGSHALDWNGVLDIGSFRRNYFRPALRELGMADMRPHDLGRAEASLWLAAGFSVVEVSRWLGHGFVTTTDAIYTHLYPTDYAATVARFEGSRLAARAESRSPRGAASPVGELCHLDLST